jgi:hypothetical protein
MRDAGYIEVQIGGARAKRRGVALVDVDDAEQVGAYSWFMDGKGYAMRCTPRGEGKRLFVYLHREILGLVPGDGIQADHINGDKLDNRRVNLRVCTAAENQQNLYRCGPHRGATWGGKHWQARVMLDGKRHFLGCYATQAEAAAVAAAFRRSHMPFSSDARSSA